MAAGIGRTKRKLTPTQARAARRARRQKRKRLLRWGGLSLLGIVSLAFIVGLFAGGLPIAGRGSGGGTPEGPGQRIEDAGRSHISIGQVHDTYTSVPATSGPHYSGSSAPTTWGVHDQFVQDEVRVHNLEHGGIGIHYNCPEGCPELVEQLTAIMDRAERDEGLKVLMSPYPDMATRIALTAWTFLDAFDVFDEDRVIEFIQAHESSANAPEPFAR